MELRQLSDPETQTCSYLLWDTDTQDAALVDPVLSQVQRDIQLIRELGLTLRYTLETHVHADHITGSGLLREKFGSMVLVHENTRTKCADVFIKDGDALPLGNEKIGVLFTPGHTNNHVSLLVPGAVLTGDSLLIRGCGRTDFDSGDAGVLFDSITRKLFLLSDHTLVYPGHETNGHGCSTIGEEKQYNLRLAEGTSRNEFIAIMNSLDLAPPQHLHEALPSNLRCGTNEELVNKLATPLH
jgi:glyoxylase-like metal-dependent hydrolase (beta-lactamase superfamily II)